MNIVRIRMYVGPPSMVYKVSTISKTLGLKLGDHTNVMLIFQCHRDLCQQMITMGVLVGCCATSTSTQVHRKHLALHRPFPSHLPQVRTSLNLTIFSSLGHYSAKKLKSFPAGTTPPLSRRVDSTSPSSDVSETDDYSRFSVTYIGSATLDPPFTQQSILDALHLFTVSKSAAVQVAAAGKNTVQMQVSATGINLNDQTHRLFITRNYPRKQVIGHTLHPTDKNCFAFATTRPGLSDLKCHIFRVNKEAMSNKVAEAIRYWLDLSLQ